MNDMSVCGNVFDIQHFCISDGPGIRTVVFLKGCPLRCKWCHNPESHFMNSQIMFYEQMCIGCGACVAVCPNGCHLYDHEKHHFARERCLQCGKCVQACFSDALRSVGKTVSVSKVIDEVLEDSIFYETSNGGITLSGGEPLAQPSFSIALLRAAKKKGINTCMETCGYFDPELLDSVTPLCDLFLWDMKDTSPERHKQYTGVSNERIIKNLLLADSMGAKTRLRCILVNGVNTNEQHYKSIVDLFGRLKCCEGVEFLPYHSYGSSKSLALSNESTVNDDWSISQKQMDFVMNFLHQNGVPIFNESKLETSRGL